MSRDREEEDLEELAHAFFENLEYDPSVEYGHVGLDPKRPFGNSDVEGDILEIIGEEPEGDDGHDKCWSSDQRQYAEELYKDKLVPYLKRKWQEMQ